MYQTDQRLKTEDCTVCSLPNNKQTQVCSCILQMQLKRVGRRSSLFLITLILGLSTFLSPDCHEKKPVVLLAMTKCPLWNSGDAFEQLANWMACETRIAISATVYLLVLKFQIIHHWSKSVGHSILCSKKATDSWQLPPYSVSIKKSRLLCKNKLSVCNLEDMQKWSWDPLSCGKWMVWSQWRWKCETCCWDPT